MQPKSLTLEFKESYLSAFQSKKKLINWECMRCKGKGAEFSANVWMSAMIYTAPSKKTPKKYFKKIKNPGNL